MLSGHLSISRDNGPQLHTAGRFLHRTPFIYAGKSGKLSAVKSERETAYCKRSPSLECLNELAYLTLQTRLQLEEVQCRIMLRKNAITPHGKQPPTPAVVTAYPRGTASSSYPGRHERLGNLLGTILVENGIITHRKATQPQKE